MFKNSPYLASDALSLFRPILTPEIAYGEYAWVCMAENATSFVAASNVNQFGAGVASAAALLSLLFLLKKFIAGTPVTKLETPLEIKFKEQFVTRREFDHLEAEVQKITVNQTKMQENILTAIAKQSTHLDEKLNLMGSAGHKSRGYIHEKVNAISNEVAALKALYNHQSKRGL